MRLLLNRVSGGFAVLEMAGLALVLSVALVFGLGFADLFGKTIFIRRSLEKSIHRIAIQPIKASLDIGGALDLSVKRDELDSTIDESVSRFEAELLKNYPDLASESSYLIEGMYQVVSLDSSTGHFLGLSGLPQTISKGTLVPDSSSFERASFDRAIEELTSRVDVSGAASIAEPSGSSVLGTDESYRYVPLSVVYGIRAFLSLRGSPASIVKGESQIVSNVLVVPSRGGVR